MRHRIGQLMGDQPVAEWVGDVPRSARHRLLRAQMLWDANLPQDLILDSEASDAFA